MKKILLATAMAVSVAGLSFAATAPVTDFDSDTANVQLGYAFMQKAGENSGHLNGYTAGLQLGVNDKVAVEFNHNHIGLNNGRDWNTNALSGYYAVHNNANLYGTAMHMNDADDHKWGYQVGVVGYMPIAESLEGYLKAGVGHNFKNTMQLGVKYGLTPALTVNAYYEHDSFDDSVDHVNGFYTGVGYSF